MGDRGLSYADRFFRIEGDGLKFGCIPWRRKNNPYSNAGMKARHLLEMIAPSPALRGSIEQCESFLTWVQYLTFSQNGTAWLTGLFITDPAGKGICGTFSNVRSFDISDRDHYRQMLETRNFVTSEIILGLCAIPFIDVNPKGNGYFTFNERKPEIAIFLFGFAVLWSSLIVLGTFLRGPNWNFFGPYEYWDLHKLLALNNVNLSEYFWVKLLHMKLPTGTVGKFVRELPGIILVVFYIGVLPGILAMTRKTWTIKLGSRTFTMTFGLRKYFEKLGPWRYSIFVMLLLCMIALPIKMVLRWTLNLKYIVSLPEIFFNI